MNTVSFITLSNKINLGVGKEENKKANYKKKRETDKSKFERVFEYIVTPSSISVSSM